jgi:hypothetical protein
VRRRGGEEERRRGGEEREEREEREKESVRMKRGECRGIYPFCHTQQYTHTANMYLRFSHLRAAVYIRPPLLHLSSLSISLHLSPSLSFSLHLSPSRCLLTSGPQTVLLRPTVSMDGQRCK